MATIQQIEANRRNAQKSTGPRSDAGKQHSRDNALKHGMCSHRVVLPFEDPQEYHLLHARIVSEQQPRSTIEMLLLDRIAAAFWRLERAIGVESALMSSSVRNLKIRCKVDDQPGGRNEGIDYYEGLSICMSKDPRAFDIQMRYQTTVRRELTQMLGQLERIRRNPLPSASELVNLPPLEGGDVIEIPTAASASGQPVSATLESFTPPSSAEAPLQPATDSAPAEASQPASPHGHSHSATRPPAAEAPPSPSGAPAEGASASSQPSDKSAVTREIGFVSQSSAAAPETAPPPLSTRNYTHDGESPLAP